VGPGVLLYELQQPSDITFRVDDWGRPRSAERPLHPADALAAVDPASRPAIVHAAPGRVVTGEHFALDLVAARAALDPAGRTLHVVTAVDGPAEMTGDGWVERLAALETLIVPASAGPYDLRPAAGARALVAGLP
jgi:mannose-6-phosphate isomerase